MQRYCFSVDYHYSQNITKCSKLPFLLVAGFLENKKAIAIPFGEKQSPSLFHIIFILLPRILGWIRQASWLVVSDILDAKILEYLEQGLAYVRESYGTVVWIALLNQDVAIEAAHLVDSEDTDTTE